MLKATKQSQQWYCSRACAAGSPDALETSKATIIPLVTLLSATQRLDTTAAHWDSTSRTHRHKSPDHFDN